MCNIKGLRPEVPHAPHTGQTRRLAPITPSDSWSSPVYLQLVREEEPKGALRNLNRYFEVYLTYSSVSIFTTNIHNRSH